MATLLLFALAVTAVAGGGVSGGLSPADASGAARRLFEWRPFLAPFHHVVLHLPIGFVVIAFALELYSLRHPREHLERAISLVLVLSVISALVTIILGLMRGASGGYEARALYLHKWFGVAVGAATLLAWAVHREVMDRPRARWLTHVYRVILVADIAALAIAGHQGGNLTHGSNYLVKNAPHFVKELLDEEPEARAEESAVGQDKVFAEQIQPIFESKCASCHGAQKQKGGYRLDDPAIAVHGGDSGEPAITPGDPFKSNLVRLILLPEEHDEVMPPSGKARLSDEETMTIIRWIQNGAHFASGQAGEESPAKPPASAVAAAGPPPGALSTPVSEPAPAQPAPQPPQRSETAPVMAAVPEKVDFAQHIKPLLEVHCLHCHGPTKQKANLRFDQRASAFAGGRRWGPAIVPGNAEQSPMYRRIAMPPEQDVAEDIMPPPQREFRLTPDEIDLIRRWIDAGAAWPENVTLRERTLAGRPSPPP